MIFSIVQKRGKQMTKRHVRLLAWMLVGMYIRIVFSVSVYPDWVNLAIRIAGLIMFWLSAYQLLTDDQQGTV